VRTLRAFLLLIAAVGWASAASADMSGHYEGTGDVSGIALDLQQSGNALQGVFTGQVRGTLQGQTDGGNNAIGTIQLAPPDNASLQFQALWSPQGLAMRVQDSSGVSDVFFALAAAGQPQPPPQPAPPPGAGPTTPPPLPGPSNVQYYTAVNGQQIGPMSLDEIAQRIRAGQTGPADLVWKTGAPAWARADSYPELAAIFNAPPPLPPPGGGPPPLPPGGGGEGGGGGPTPPNNPPGGGEGGGSGMTPPSGGAGGGGGGSGSGSGAGGGTGGGEGNPTPPNNPPGGGGGGGMTPPSQ